MKTIINIKNKKDLITLDLRTKQLRYLKNVIKPNNIEFIDLSNDDIGGYNWLYQNEYKTFLKVLCEEIFNFLNIKVNINNLKEII